MILSQSLDLLLESTVLLNKDVILMLKKENDSEICHWRIRKNEEFKPQMRQIAIESPMLIPQYLQCEVLKEEFLSNSQEIPAIYIIHLKTK